MDRQSLTAGGMTLALSVQYAGIVSASAGDAHIPTSTAVLLTILDLRPGPTMAAPLTMPPTESSESFNPDLNRTSTPPKEGAPALASPMEDVAPAWPEQRTGPPDAQTQQRVHDVLYSDVGVATLLNRLKASIASARVGNPQAQGAMHPADMHRRTLPTSSSGGARSKRNMRAASRN